MFKILDNRSTKCKLDYPKKKFKIMKIINEFKEFALRGNMIEMAVGIVIGASFNSVAVSYTHLTLPTICSV